MLHSTHTIHLLFAVTVPNSSQGTCSIYSMELVSKIFNPGVNKTTTLKCSSVLYHIITQGFLKITFSQLFMFE